MSTPWADPSETWTRLVAGGQAILFLLVGLDFAIDPHLGAELSALAAALGLSGTIDAGHGTLWHALAVGQMVSLAALSGLWAARPREEGTFCAIAATKLTSALTFGVAACTTPALVICAALDLLNLCALLGLRHLGRRMAQRDVLSRYLRHMGAEEPGLENAIARLPPHLQPVHALGRLGLSLLGPLLILRQPMSAGALDDPQFERLLERLCHHRLPELRLLWMLVRTPALPLVAKGAAP